MADIPRAVLSEQFEAHLAGRRLRSAVFLTYRFEPAFFELQVLPALMDVPVSHADSIRLVQLEDALRSLPGEITVYYDANGLHTGDGGSAKLDVRRIPIHHPTGVFHPKNAFLLVEDVEPDEEGHHRQTLIVACMSANLTRAGWWENVECCHIEEIPEGSASSLRNSLRGFLSGLRGRATVRGKHRALEDILRLLAGVQPRVHKSSDGRLHTHFFEGREPLPDFLERVAGTRLRGACLEILSPYFDDAPECQPLDELVERFSPAEVRVLLPRNSAGAALCRKDFYRSVLRSGTTSWGRLPIGLLKLSPRDEVGGRAVHAKVYRFFSRRPKREIWFLGSANLTRPAHQKGGNLESGILVELEPPRQPDFWLVPESSQPREFETRGEDEPSTSTGGTRLSLVYHWDRGLAEGHWDGASGSPVLKLAARGVSLGSVGPLLARSWRALPHDLSSRIGEALTETSVFLVEGEGSEPVPLLVQEEGMSHKPSLLFHLSAADILRFWALLTPAQRAAFLEVRAPELAHTGQGADLVAHVTRVHPSESIFDRFAGVFHAFGCLERTVRAALDSGNAKEADYRLFGRKYDSLGSLLDRIEKDDAVGDGVDRYVILMCARQLAQEIARQYPEYKKARRQDFVTLQERFGKLAAIRQHLIDRESAGLRDFLDWFDPWFLGRAEPVPEPAP